jgi:hypothetical protein
LSSKWAAISTLRWLISISSSFPKKQCRHHHSPNSRCGRQGQLLDNRWPTQLGEVINQNNHNNDHDAPVVDPATVTDQWTTAEELVAMRNHHMFQLPLRP